MSFEIDPTDVGDSATGTRVFVLNIRGTAFLWHQVGGGYCGTSKVRGHLIVGGGHLTVATASPYTLSVGR